MLDSLPGDDIARAAYLVVLGSALIGIVLVRIRPGLIQGFKTIAAWVVIFGVVAIGASLYEDVQTQQPMQSYSAQDAQITVPRSRDGHYYLTLGVNGVPTRFVVDTGATDIVLTQEAARAAGIPLDNLPYMGRAMTANGEVRTARVTLNSLTLDGITDTNIKASVNGGALHESLLGMRYLSRFSSLQITDNTLILTR
ncbi:TIGR02281 family clan AA aspartic protease [Donghicola sp. XS_ASV15]|uniref:retropepsin-like aspartic protease family protein n=1 Tax=Donghicola sp. XS_ASV15 TaxID=3241295 RepID=UPI0035183C5B